MRVSPSRLALIGDLACPVSRLGLAYWHALKAPRAYYSLDVLGILLFDPENVFLLASIPSFFGETWQRASEALRAPNPIRTFFGPCTWLLDSGDFGTGYVPEARNPRPPKKTIVRGSIRVS